MKTKNLLLLATLMCAMPNVAFSTMPSETSCCGCSCGGTHEVESSFDLQEALPALEELASPTLDPEILASLSILDEEEDLLTVILEQNPNPHLQAKAAHRLGDKHWGQAEWSCGTFAEDAELLKTAKQYMKQARDLYASLEQTDEIKEIIDIID